MNRSAWKSKTTLLSLFGVALVGALASGHAFAQTAQTPTVVFQNVRIFDGRSNALSAPSNVLVRGNKIEKISPEPISVDRSANAHVVNGSGRTLMPGLIDAHSHPTFNTTPFAFAANADPNYLQIRSTVHAGGLLMDGFTSLRDVGGPSMEL